MAFERLKIKDHRGIKIYFTDYRDCTAEQALKVIEASEKMAPTLSQRKEYYALSLVQELRFNSEVIKRIKEASKLNEPNIIATAVVGLDNLRSLFLTAINRFSSRDMKPFKTEEEALKWIEEHANKNNKMLNVA